MRNRRSNVVSGASRSTTGELAKWTSEADKVITF